MLESPWGTSARRSAIVCHCSSVSARHQVEDHAHALHRAPEDADVAQALAGVVLLERELEAFPERAGGDAVGVVRDVGRGERPQRGAVVLRALVDSVGGVVGHLVVVAGDALAGRAQRIEGGEALDVANRRARTRQTWCSSLRSVGGRHVVAARLAPKAATRGQRRRHVDAGHDGQHRA